MNRAIKSLRRRLWQSMLGCDCSAIDQARYRCTKDCIRCNGRLKMVYKNYHSFGLLTGPGSADGDGLDPKASMAAIKRREAICGDVREKP